MKIDLEKLTKLERLLHIEVPVEKVSTAFEKIYKNLQKQASVRGFRKGKAPINKIKDLYGEKVRQDVMSDLVREHYVEALDEHSLIPVSMPSIQIKEFSEDKPFKFSAQFEIRPDIELKNYLGLKVEKEKLVLDDSKTKEIMENIRNNRAEMVAVFEDRPAQINDFAVIDFEGFINGERLENASGTQQTLELGSNSFIPGFEEGIVGMKIGESKSLHLKFPDNYHAAQLSGKDVEFKVNLKGLKKKSLPELNDEFAKSIGQESLDKLKEVIEADYKNSEEKRIADEFNSRLLKVLVKENPVDVPKSLLTEQKNALIEDIRVKMQGQGMTNENFEEYKNKWDSDFANTATFMIQSNFLVNAIASKENLQATEQDVQNKIEEYARQTGLDLEKLAEYYNDDSQKSRLMFRITEEKVVAYLSKEAEVIEVSKEALS